jgi:hypothetical protein
MQEGPALFCGEERGLICSVQGGGSGCNGVPTDLIEAGRFVPHGVDDEQLC